MEKEGIQFLKQLIKTLEDSAPQLEEAYKKKDYERFVNIKRSMLQIQDQIATLIR
jgi:hypothetical protein